jgi:hypothetical protein
MLMINLYRSEEDDPLARVGEEVAFADPHDDPYIADPDYESSSEKDDIELKEGDQLLLATCTEDEAANLSVYLYNDEKQQLYVHHDVMLSDMPLCVEWIGIDCNTKEKVSLLLLLLLSLSLSHCVGQLGSSGNTSTRDRVVERGCVACHQSSRSIGSRKQRQQEEQEEQEEGGAGRPRRQCVSDALEHPTT